jgi:hypothetical protein
VKATYIVIFSVIPLLRILLAEYSSK